jgi:hypothetical protein
MHQCSRVGQESSGFSSSGQLIFDDSAGRHITDAVGASGSLLAEKRSSDNKNRVLKYYDSVI